jgi:hypothetical protein
MKRKPKNKIMKGLNEYIADARDTLIIGVGLVCIGIISVFVGLILTALFFILPLFYNNADAELRFSGRDVI